MTHSQSKTRIEQTLNQFLNVFKQEPAILASPTHVEMEELVNPSTLQRTYAGVLKDLLELIVKKVREIAYNQSMYLTSVSCYVSW